MPNLYGNIIDNLSVGLIGVAGLVGGASFSAGMLMVLKINVYLKLDHIQILLFLNRVQDTHLMKPPVRILPTLQLPYLLLVK